MKRPESITELIKKYLTDEERFRWRTDPEKMLQETKKRQGEDRGWKKALERTREHDKKKKKSKGNKRDRPKNEWFPMPNKFIETLYKQSFTSIEQKCLLFLVRKTWGWNKASEFIRVKTFAKDLGLWDVSVCRALSRLKKRHIIKQLPNRAYMIQEDYGIWKDRPKRRGFKPDN